ncbi:hypothetical protein QCD85_06135 [Paenibacillus sp. PsM32]|uniref:hypothetical protein n=1 Tax=Paenibacillus sp. PsM32 TaxID=3030536 RepID=UPI00263B1D5C|nr:hypothetical protein [Paenibacillus sp. PsM32]MDN4617669.1 hypothetical protein [Paenibacillus sp. PsM32]
MLKMFKNTTLLVKSAKQIMVFLLGYSKQKVTALNKSITGRMYTLATTQKGVISIEAVALIIVGLVLIVMFVPQAKELVTAGFTKAKSWMDQIS